MVNFSNIDKRKVISLFGLCALGAFVYFQFRAWGTFDWQIFLVQTRGAAKLPLVIAVLSIYASYLVLILRWQLFLRPLRRSSLTSLVAPTVIGFTSLVILGRPGELVRPYLLARSQRLSFASQMAMWFVERVLDLSALAFLIAITLFVGPELSTLPYVAGIRSATVMIGTTILLLAAIAFLLRHRVPAITAWMRAAGYRVADKFHWTSANEVEAFARELLTLPTILKATGLSLLLWFLNALACWQVVRAFPEPMHRLGLGAAVIVMGFAILGSLVQLPAVGGGSQLAAIAALIHVFRMPKELAVSCGISLWLVMFASIVPLGLVLGHREGLSLWKLFRESETTRDQLVSTGARELV